MLNVIPMGRQVSRGMLICVLLIACGASHSVQALCIQFCFLPMHNRWLNAAGSSSPRPLVGNSQDLYQGHSRELCLMYSSMYPPLTGSHAGDMNRAEFPPHAIVFQGFQGHIETALKSHVRLADLYLDN